MSVVSCFLHMTGNPSAHVSHMNVHINKSQVGKIYEKKLPRSSLRVIKPKYSSARRFLIFHVYLYYLSRWTSGLRRRSAAILLLGLLVRIPLVAWMSVSWECCVLSDQGCLHRADTSSRGVLPTEKCLSVVRFKNKCLYLKRVGRSQTKKIIFVLWNELMKYK